MALQSALLTQYLHEFEKYYDPAEKPLLFKAPGRINLIGEHLDYNGGIVLPAAISLGIYALVHFRNDSIVRLRSASKNQEVSINISNDYVYNDDFSWANYPIGVIQYLKNQSKTDLTGADILFFSTLPEGSGLSSSASLEVLTAFLFQFGRENKKPTESEKIQSALLCQQVENEFIGVQCGIMDQFSIAMGKKDHAILLDTNTMRYEYIPIELTDKDNIVDIIVLNSKKPRELAGSEFNLRREQSAQAWQEINKSANNLTRPAATCLAQANLADLQYIQDPLLQKRARHVITENQRVHISRQALLDRDIQTFAQQLNESHESLHNDYNVTGFELHSLVQAAQNAPGCLGARMTGAGFGGCALALVARDRREEFSKTVLDQYKTKTHIHGECHTIEIDQGPGQISFS